MTVWLIRILAVVAVISALLAITRRNPIYSAVFLGLNFLALGGIFAIYVSPFIGAVQIIVYAGAILVLFVIAIMVLNLRDEDLGPPKRTLVKLFSVFSGVALAWLLVTLSAFLRGPEKGGVLGAYEVGKALLEKHVVAFEVVSVLLIVGIVGAITLAKRRMEV